MARVSKSYNVLRYLLFFSLVLAKSSFALATEYTFEFSGSLTSIDAPASTAFSVGQGFEGTYTFTYDGNPDGFYNNSISSASITIGGQTWAKDASSSGNIIIRDDTCCTRDLYQLGLNTNSSPTTTGDEGQILTPKSVSFEFSDTDAEVFSDSSLPLTPPNIAEFESTQFVFRFDDPNNFSDAVIVGEVTALYVPLNPADFSGTYSFNFSDQGSGYFVYDGLSQSIPLIDYDFGLFGSGSSSFGSSLTATVFGNPPSETIAQDNTLFALNGDFGDVAQYDFNFSNYGSGGYTYNQVTQESSSFLIDFGSLGSFSEIESSTINAIFGSPPTPATSGNGVFLPLHDAVGDPIPGSGVRFYSDGRICIEQNSACFYYAEYELKKVSAYGLRVKADGSYCVRPDAGLCNGIDDLASGSYQITLVNVGEVTSGTNVVAVPEIVDETGTTIQNPPQVQLTFDEVTDAGDGGLSVTIVEENSSTSPDLPSLFQLSGTATYIDIETSASFTGEVEVCLDYDDAGIDEQELELLHEFEPGSWKVITSPGFPDTSANRICGKTSSFSFFAIVEQVIVDSDSDGVADEADNCPSISNPLQSNFDEDAAGDACDVCPADPQNDGDGDGVCGDIDNCPLTSNSGQEDTDNDGFGDACNAAIDTDGDDWADVMDNCPSISNVGQFDEDGDGFGNVCDICSLDPFNDADGDGVCGDVDNCPLVDNSDQANTDADEFGNACDVDDDGDNVADAADNCPLVPNPDQSDYDFDGEGDVCDLDIDGDGVTDAQDRCLLTDTGEVVSAEGCSVAQLCPVGNSWKNHGAYVKCVAKTSESFVENNLITEDEKDALVSDAGSSDIGKKSK